MARILFSVPGTPKPKGSFRPMVSKSTGRIIFIPPKQGKSWQERVAYFARVAMGPRALAEGPVTVWMMFYFDRPKSHYGTGKNAYILKASAPKRHTKPPDIDKLQRAILDAFTGTVFKDDKQVDRIVCDKAYAPETKSITEGVAITIMYDEQETQNANP